MSTVLPEIEPASAESMRARRPLFALSDLITANRQRDALYLLSEQLHRARTPDDIYEAALDAIESALECDRSAILLFDDAGVMRFVAWHGLSPDYRAAVTGHSPWTAEDRDAAPIPIADIRDAALDAPVKELILAEGIGATAFIPLLRENRVIGKFMAYFRAPHAFTQEDLAISLIIARQLAFAIQRVQTERQLRDQQRELAEELQAAQLLQRLSVELAHEVDVAGLYEKIVDAARTLMRSDFASMQQLHPHRGEHGELRLLAYRGFDPAAARFWTWVTANSTCSCGIALRQRERVLIPDMHTSPLPDPAQRECYRATGIHAVQSTPLMSRRGSLVGMMSTHWARAHQPLERDLRHLDVLARLAADLIERNAFDEELRTREERARTLTQLLSDVPWQARADGAFEELQPAWENYTGQSWDEHAGHGWLEAIHPEDRDAARTTWSTACFHAQPIEFHARLWHARSNAYRACVLRATPIRNEDGSTREWVGACTDVR